MPTLPPQAVCAGWSRLVYPLGIRALPSWFYWGPLPYMATERDDIVCILWAFVCHSCSVSHPAALLLQVGVVKPSSLPEKLVTDSSLLEILAHRRWEGFWLTYTFSPILWSVFFSILYKYFVFICNL